MFAVVVGDDLGVRLLLGPRAPREVDLRELLEGLDRLLGLAGVDVPAGDLPLPPGRALRGGLQLEEEGEGLDPPLPAVLLVVAPREAAHHPEGVALAADGTEELVHFLGRDRAVLGEHDDQVL